MSGLGVASFVARRGVTSLEVIAEGLLPLGQRRELFGKQLADGPRMALVAANGDRPFIRLSDERFVPRERADYLQQVADKSAVRTCSLNAVEASVMEGLQAIMTVDVLEPVDFRNEVRIHLVTSRRSA